MSQSLIITTKKDNILEFEAEVRGIKDPKMKVQFVIQTDEMNLAFPAKHEKEHTWSVTVPPLSFLKHKDYPFMITVDLEGYHFEPMTGELTAVGEIEPSVTKPERVEKKEEKKPEVKKEEPKEEKKTEPKPEPEKKVEEPEPAKEEEEEKKDVKEDDELSRLAANIINRETLRKNPKDVAVRKVLGEVKNAPKKEEPIVEQPVTMEDVLTPQEQAKIDREAKVKAILGQVRTR